VVISADRVLAFAALSLLLIVIPGPSVLFVIGRALAHGRRTALITVAGNTLGAYVLVVAVALGVGAVVERSVLVFEVLRLVGAAYLVFLGIKAVRQRGSLSAAFSNDAPARSGLRTLWEGFAVGVTSPKTIVFFTAVLPQFVDRDQGNVAAQMLLLGLVFNVIAIVSDSAFGLAAATARNWFARSPRRLALVGRAGGFKHRPLGDAKRAGPRPVQAPAGRADLGRYGTSVRDASVGQKGHRGVRQGAGRLFSEALRWEAGGCVGGTRSSSL
jgi:threonine/homoserine/homoserine lactone efflux protein